MTNYDFPFVCFSQILSRPIRPRNANINKADEGIDEWRFSRGSTLPLFGPKTPGQKRNAVTVAANLLFWGNTREKCESEKRDLENRAREKRKSGQVTDDVAALKRNTHTTCGTRPKRRWRRRRLRFSTAFPCPCYYRFWWKWGEGKGKRRRQSSPTKFGTRVGKLHSGEESEYGNQNSEGGVEWNYGLHVARYYDLAFLLFSCLQLLTHSSHTHPLFLRLSAVFFSGQPLKATNKKASS